MGVILGIYSSLVLLLTYSFFKGTPSQCPGLLPVNTVTCDGHQVTFGRHHVTQQRQVAIVDVGAVEGNDVIHLLLN